MQGIKPFRVNYLESDKKIYVKSRCFATEVIISY